MKTAGEETGAASPLDPEIDALYRGSLDGFVARRDALAKALRAAGRRDDARSVKALRKPRRLAWALNVASMAEPAAVESVARAVASAVAAQSGTGDLRTCLASLREEVRDLAAVASRLAWAGEQSVDPGELADAVMASIGSRDAFELLRAGRLIDIPEAGGIELLGGPVPSEATGTAKEPATVPSAASDAGPVSPPEPDPALLEAVHRAETGLAAARERLAAAEQSVRMAEEASAAAERRLVLARSEAAVRLKEVERTRNHAEAAADAVADAEGALARARSNGGTD